MSQVGNAWMRADVLATPMSQGERHVDVGGRVLTPPSMSAGRRPDTCGRPAHLSSPLPLCFCLLVCFYLGGSLFQRDRDGSRGGEREKGNVSCQWGRSELKGERNKMKEVWGRNWAGSHSTCMGREKKSPSLPLQPSRVRAMFLP